MPTAIGSKSSPSSNSRDAQHVYVMVGRKCRKLKWINREAEVIRATPCPQRNVSYAHVALWISLGERLPARWNLTDAQNGRDRAQLYAFRKLIKVLQKNEKRRFKLTW